MIDDEDFRRAVIAARCFEQRHVDALAHPIEAAFYGASVRGQVSGELIVGARNDAPGENAGSRVVERTRLHRLCPVILTVAYSFVIPPEVHRA